MDSHGCVRVDGRGALLAQYFHVFEAGRLAGSSDEYTAIASELNALEVRKLLQRNDRQADTTDLDKQIVLLKAKLAPLEAEHQAELARQEAAHQAELARQKQEAEKQLQEQLAKQASELQARCLQVRS